MGVSGFISSSELEDKQLEKVSVNGDSGGEL
jgi:hypothetical protein